MPQNGFHGLVGLAVCKILAKRVDRRRLEPFVPGVVLGAMLPDADIYPTAFAAIMGRRDLIEVIHRSATHSLLLILVLFVTAAFMKNIGWKWGLLGAAIGVVSHVGLDFVLWFMSVDVFWPASRFVEGVPIVDLWGGYRAGPLFVNIREAFEFVAFALLLAALAKRLPVGSPRRKNLVKWIALCMFLFALSLTTAFYFRDRPDLQNYVVTTPYLLALYPYCLVQVWKSRGEVAAWAGNYCTSIGMNTPPTTDRA